MTVIQSRDDELYEVYIKIKEAIDTLANRLDDESKSEPKYDQEEDQLLEAMKLTSEYEIDPQLA